MIILKWEPKTGIWCEEEDGVEKLRKNFFGQEKDGKVFLNPEEALYVITFLNGICYIHEQPAGFNEIASYYVSKNPRLMIDYNAYRDWRDRGLILKKFSEIKLPKSESKKPKGEKRYPSHTLRHESLDAQAHWYPESLFSVVDDEKAGQHLFNTHWFGQLGVYRQERGSLLRLDFMETIFLSKHFGLKVIEASSNKALTGEQILEHVSKKREYAKRLYEVYEDWRLKGYVVKTGFKFGSHFRIYFPGASPALSPGKQDGEDREWIHSRHVLHVFPKEQKLLVSEWARAVRVAHSVKKTFLLSVPDMKEKDILEGRRQESPSGKISEFLAFRRKKQGQNLVREDPGADKSRYLLIAFTEDDHIGGIELASLLKNAESLRLQLLLSITDRETSITYYVLNKILLPDSKHEYYEIEWMKP
ncbi:MAG: tRNA-intron lyase [Candidatus Aenigmarchaeota archaeon]|nr:tRNA-intron lyase [Candidatus Aenigmarchaeota archaeon]